MASCTPARGGRAKTASFHRYRARRWGGKSRRVKEIREKGKETVKAASMRNRGSGKVRVRQLKVRVN